MKKKRKRDAVLKKIKSLFTPKVRSTAFLVLSVLFALSCVGTVIYYIFGPSAAYLHSDCTDSILWAKASVESGKMFDPNFTYAALLPVGGSLIMIPLIKIFGYTMLSQQLGMAIFTVIFFLSIFFLCKSAKITTPVSLFCVGVVAMTLCSSVKLREIFYEHSIYYSISVMLLSLLLGLAFKFYDIYEGKAKTRTIIIMDVAVAAAFVLGALDGMQVISIGMLPVFAAVAADIVFSKENKIFSSKNLHKGLFCLIAGVASAFGFAWLNAASSAVSAGYADAYSSYSNMSEWYNNFAKLFEQWFALFGVDAHYGMNMFSFDSILNVIRIAAAMLIGVAPIIALFCFKKLDKYSRMIVVAHFAMTGVILFGYIFGILSAANWRLSPMICTGLLICAVLLKLAKENVVANRIAVLLSVIMILMCGVSWLQIGQMHGLGIEDNPKYEMLQTLKENDLTYGYATFWNSQAITLLSDSEVEVININVKEDGIDIYKYQTDLRRVNNPDGKQRTFILLTDFEANELRASDKGYSIINGCDETIECDGYVILVFNDPKENQFTIFN